MNRMTQTSSPIIDDRTAFIGGSDAAGILGMSRWATPLSVWAEKTGQIVPKDKDSEAMELGRELEAYVAKRFERKSGKKAWRVNERLFHKQYPFIGGRIDRRVVGEKAILECKTAAAWKAKEWEADEIPREYIIQCFHYLAVSGADRAYIAVLIGNQDFKWKVVERDDKTIRDLISKEVDFWNTYVIPKVMPSLITADDAEVLGEIYPEAMEGKVIELGDNANILVETLKANKADLINLERTIDQNENQLKALVGDAEYATTDLYKIYWSNRKQSRIDTKALREAHPEIVAKFLKEIQSRAFTFKSIKIDDGGQNGHNK